MTVGLPIYNAMPWLPETMDSLLTQTYRNFYILAIVDGATDDSLSYLQSIRDPRLRILVQSNAGITATLNRLLHEVRTPWLVRQDADDVSYPQRLEKLAEVIERYPDTGMFYSFADYYPVNKSAGTFRCSRRTAPELRSMVESGYLLSICHPTVALHVKKTVQAGGYRLDLPAEDADLWWRMALAREIRCIPEALIGFRQNETSVSSRSFMTQEISGLYVQYLLLSHLWNLRPLPFPEIVAELEKLASPLRLKAKNQLRSMNLQFSAQKRLSGILFFLRAFFTSPSYIAGRVKDELLPGAIMNGVSPQLFLQRKEALWML